MSVEQKSSDSKMKARRRFLGAGAGLVGLTVSSSAQAGFFKWWFPKNIDPEVPCFLKGTRIDTQDCPVAIEDIKAGDRVKIIPGSLDPVKGIGVSTTTVG